MVRVDIRGEQHSIGEVFGERYAFVIPTYQRPYAWTIEHAGELLDDLLEYLGEPDEDVDELNPYFLGTIVLVKQDRPDAQIVDGQQRLITLTILLAVLRSLVPPEFADSITRRIYEPADPLNNIPPHYRVRPKDRDVAFMQQYIQGEGGIERLRNQVHVELSESQRNMRTNALHFVREVGALPMQRRVRLAQYIVQRCLLIVVTTPDLDSAYRIFSVMNNRGLDLTTADILKSEVLGPIPSAIQDEYAERWEELEEKLGTDGLSELIFHVRTIYREKPTSGNIVDEFRAYVMPAAPTAPQLVDDIIVPMGAAYHVVKTATYEHDDGEKADQINLLLRWLNKIDNTDWLPPAMLYMHLYHAQPVRLLRFYGELERLAAMLMIRRQYSYRRAVRYRQLLRAIEYGMDLSKVGSPIQLTPQERDEMIGALSSDVYLMLPIPRNYVLQRLDCSLAGSGATYHYKIMTVEHVLPRNPNPDSQWVAWFPTAADRARWVHRLANLVLLSKSKNRQAYNYEFDIKKRTYFTSKTGISPFAITTQVLQEREWTPQVLERRQNDLLNHLRQLWRL